MKTLVNGIPQIQAPCPWRRFGRSSAKKKWRYNVLHVDVVVNFLFQLIFIFPLFLGLVVYANEFKTKEKQKLTEMKN